MNRTDGGIIGAEVFRTNVDVATSNWRMEVDSVERFRIRAFNNDIVLGSVRAGRLSFYTKDVGRMNIDTNGRVGIGYAFYSPAFLLHVNDIVYHTGKLFRTDGADTVVNHWEIHTGATSTLAPKFRLSVLTDNETRLGTVVDEQMNNTNRVRG